MKIIKTDSIHYDNIVDGLNEKLKQEIKSTPQEIAERIYSIPDGDEMIFSVNRICPKCKEAIMDWTGYTRPEQGEDPIDHILECPNCEYQDLNSLGNHHIIEKNGVKYCDTCGEIMARKSDCPTPDGDYYWTRKDQDIVLSNSVGLTHPDLAPDCVQFCCLAGRDRATAVDVSMVLQVIYGMIEDPFKGWKPQNGGA